MKRKIIAIAFAILAAVFYAANVPLSKILLDYVNPTMMAGFLYLGAGIGIGFFYLLFGRKSKQEKLNHNDLPYVIGMVLLDIAAPILLMFGVKYSASSNVSLLNNFEIVATAIIALIFFKEKISLKLSLAIMLITISCIILSFTDWSIFSFSWGSLLVIFATICWGIENNCTRRISSKNTYQIVTIKGLCCGTCSLLLSLLIDFSLPDFKYILFALLLGFVSYGLSIFLYVKSQYEIGAAKTSAFYSFAPFICALLSFIILKETITLKFIIALIIMILGSIIVIIDTLEIKINQKEK